MMDIETIKRDRETWLQALETTNAKQGVTQLGDAKHGFCCLGIGCDVLGIPYHAMQGTSPVFAQRVGLRTESGGPLEGEELGILTEMNDSKDYNFAEIAAHIRAHMDQYFVEGTL